MVSIRISEITFRHGTDQTVRRQRLGEFFAKRMRAVFPELRDKSRYPAGQLAQLAAENIKFAGGHKVELNLAGLTAALWERFNLRVEHPEALHAALAGKISTVLPGQIVPRLRPRQSQSADPDQLAAKFAELETALARRGKISEAAAKERLAWARANMPAAYFLTCAVEELAVHLEQAVEAGQQVRLSEGNQEVFLVSDHGSSLAAIVDTLRAEGKSVKRAKLYHSLGDKLAIYIFDIGKQKEADLADPEQHFKVADFKRTIVGTIIVVNGAAKEITVAEIDAFIGSLSQDYLVDTSLSRMLHHLELFIKAKEHARETAIEIDPSPANDATRLTLVGTNIPKVGFLSRLTRILARHQLTLREVFVETLENETTTRAISSLSQLIDDREPIRAIVESLLPDSKASDEEKSLARQAINSWQDAKSLAPLLDDLTSANSHKRKQAVHALVAIGSHAQEAATIATFYLVKQNGEQLDEVRDLQLIRHLTEDLQIAKWAFANEFTSLQEQSGLRIGQANLVAAAASFTQEMLSYPRPQTPLSWAEVSAVFTRQPALTKLLVDYFECKFDPYLAQLAYVPGDGVARDMGDFFRWVAEVLPPEEQAIMMTGLAFVDAVRTTNYFQPTSSLAFELEPAFAQTILGLSQVFPDTPYGVYYICGVGFRGFHDRFEDIARGGIRIVPSTDRSPYKINTLNVYGNTYRLSSTQNSKNIKGEIPEGGAKGELDLRPGADPIRAFHDYVDGLLDLILGTKTLLFLGPDEGTAGLMDAGAEQAAHRGYLYPRTFTTGKSDGGIPHDKYGITTTGVHYAEELVIADLKLREEDLTKVQTGGPDGDLGRNELKFSQARTIGVVDGFGVAFDPAGLDNGELLRLAAAEASIAQFDPAQLSGSGFVSSSADYTPRLLPNGKQVPGANLIGEPSNNFADHLIFQGVEADLFVPAGGRQNVINGQNVHLLFKSDGRPRFRIIVEGANVFLTQEARLLLEASGVTIIKDSTANKGGVISSSHEVLAAFILAPAEFRSIYDTYVQQIKQRIRASVEKEYLKLKELKSQAGIGSNSTAADLIGAEMKRLFHLFMAVELPDDPAIDALLLSHVLPVAIETFGQAEILSRLRKIPVAYRKGIAAARLASAIVYREGLNYLPNTKSLSARQIIKEAKLAVG